MVVCMFNFKACLTDLNFFFTAVLKTQSLILILHDFFYGFLVLLFWMLVSSYQKEVLLHDRHIMERPLLVTSKNKHVSLYFL